MSLPGAFEEERGFAFAVLNRGKRKGFAWIWLERIRPKKARVPCPEVIALRVADEAEKEMLLAAPAYYEAYDGSQPEITWGYSMDTRTAWPQLDAILWFNGRPRLRKARLYYP